VVIGEDVEFAGDTAVVSVNGSETGGEQLAVSRASRQIVIGPLTVSGPLGRLRSLEQATHAANEPHITALMCGHYIRGLGPEATVRGIFRGVVVPLDIGVFGTYIWKGRACGARRELGDFLAEKPTAGVGDRYTGRVIPAGTSFDRLCFLGLRDW